MIQTFETTRLRLVPATFDHVNAEINDLGAFARLIPAEIPANWPPESSADALPSFLRWLEAAPDGVGWFGWYALAKEAGAQGPVLVGSGGFLGPPRGGVVDVGYSVLPQYHKRGIATEMVGRLLRWAFEESEELHRISAETEWSKFVPLMQSVSGLFNRWAAREHQLRVLVVLSTSILLCSCASSQQFSGIGASNIKQSRQHLNGAVATRRISDFVSLLAEDVVDIIPSGERKGKDEVVRDFESLLKRRPDLTLILTPDRIETYPLWSLAAESGHWYESWTEKGDFTELRGAYFAMWKLSDSKWLVSSQIITPLSCKGTIYCNAE